VPVPQAGDILIRKTGINTFVLVDVISRKYVAGPYQGFEHAVSVAHMYGARPVWQQAINANGDPVGDLVLVLAT
jgi:hypothetical protein